MKRKNNYSKRLQKQLKEPEDPTKNDAPPDAAGVMQSGTVSPRQTKEMKREKHLPPAAGEYEPFNTEDSPAFSRTELSVIQKEKGKDPHEADPSSQHPSDLEPE